MNNDEKTYDPSRRNIKLGKGEGRRFKRLGDIGEELAPALLIMGGFSNLKNLNDQKINFPFADFYAERDEIKYLISVKTRNKYEYAGKLNSRYKLGRNLYKKIDEVLDIPEYKDCIPAWMTIAVEENTFDAFWGLIRDLDGGFGISMSESACSKYLCLAKRQQHEFDPAIFRNTYKKK